MLTRNSKFWMNVYKTPDIMKDSGIASMCETSYDLKKCWLSILRTNCFTVYTVYYLGCFELLFYFPSWKLKLLNKICRGSCKALANLNFEHFSTGQLKKSTHEPKCGMATGFIQHPSHLFVHIIFTQKWFSRWVITLGQMKL